MTLWTVLMLMAAAAVFAVLWPLSRRPHDSHVSEADVYRDQLSGLARDRDLGLIRPAEAEAARVEIARRLIAAGDTPVPGAAPGADTRRRLTAALALIGLPVAALALYSAGGSPDQPAQPHAVRAATPPGQLPLAELITRVEAHLENQPDDGRGWEVLAPVYLRVGRLDDAVRARRDALRLLGETATRQADLGEALTAAGNGIVTAEAKAAFDRALALDPAIWKARYFDGLAAEQDGRSENAATTWRDLLADAPLDAPWRAIVSDSLTRVAAPMPQPNAESVAAASQMAPADRDAFVRGMVERLAERLKSESQDVDGWLRLVRAYAVLGENDKAKAAALEARARLAGDAGSVKRIDDLARTLGLQT